MFKPYNAPPEIQEAAILINAKFEIFRAYIASPNPDHDELLRMKLELEELVNSTPSWTPEPPRRSKLPDAT